MLTLLSDFRKEHKQAIDQGFRGRENAVNSFDMNFAHLLLGKDRRSISGSDEVVRAVGDQSTFDELFGLLLHHERLLVMRAADAVEKITMDNRAFLIPHKGQLLALLKSALHNELKWHLALLVPRLQLDENELNEVWRILSYWALNPNESKIVRVNSLQGLFELSHQYPGFDAAFSGILQTLQHEKIPSLQARLRKLNKIKVKHERR